MALWYDGVRATKVSHALSIVLKGRVESPYRLLAIAVVGSAYAAHATVSQVWCDWAEIEADAMGVLVCDEPCCDWTKRRLDCA